MGRLVKRFGRVVPAAVLDARAAGDEILRTAAQQAERLVTEARAESDAIRGEARRAGEAAGRAEAEAAFTSVLLAARAEAEQVRRAAAPAARVLAVRMAEKVIGRSISLDASVMSDIAAQALAAARARAGLVLLRVHPDDQAQLETARPALAARIAAAVDLRLVADPSVGRAGCIVETPTGRLDARLETQLAALERAVFGEPAPTEDGGRRDG